MRVESFSTAASDIRDTDLIDAFVEDLTTSYSDGSKELRKFDRWLLASQLQKSVRRGLSNLAVSTALALARLDREYLWRRIRIIALEDIGLANLGLVATTLAIAGKAKLHRDLGEELVVASITSRLAKSLKNRAACDVSCIAQYAPVPDEWRRSVVRAGASVWKDLATSSDQPTWKRALAFHLIGGLSVRKDAGFETLSRFDLKVLLETLDELECPPLIRHIALRGRGTEGLNTSVPLAYDLTRNSTWIERSDRSWPESLEMIGSLLAATFCMYTRSGNQANSLLVRRDATLCRELALAGVRVPARAVGFLLFQAEGSVLDRRLDCQVSRDLQDEVEHAELLHIGIADQGAYLRSMLEVRMPALNDARREVARMFDAQQSLPGFG